MRRVSVGVSLMAGLTMLAGCGASYRPVISAINPVGPATQPQKYAVAISDPCAAGDKNCSTNALVNIVDVSGDTLIVTPNISPNPRYFTIGGSGSNGYVINKSGLIDAFDISGTLQTNAVTHGSLAVGAIASEQMGSTPPVQQTPGPSIFAGSNFIYITETGPAFQSVAALTAGVLPPSLQQEVPVANPVYTVGLPGAPRVYALGQGTTPGTSLGTAVAIEATTTAVSVSNRINVGRRPVYGVMNVDARRAFVLNKDDGTVSVINTQTNALDTLPVTSTRPAGTTVIDTRTAGATAKNANQAANPVWADTLNSINELAVANQGDGTNPGSLSIVNIPLCSAVSVNGNVTCDPNNPVDAVGFGDVLATVPVGINPVMVTVLQDLKKAYVANSGDGTVSVIDLTTFSLIKTIDLKGTNAPNDRIGLNGTSGTLLNYIASTSLTPAGRVYVTASDSTLMGIIYTDTDTLRTVIPLQGRGVSVQVTAR